MKTRSTARSSRKSAVRRVGLLAIAILGAILTLAMSGGEGSVVHAATANNTQMYWYQGTGPTVAAPPTFEGMPVTNVSGDLGWKADFAPVQGTGTMDSSVDAGQKITDPRINQNLAEGKTVVLKGFSLGALTAGDEVASLAERGIDMSKVKATLVSDGRMANTGAMVVLEPLAPLLKPFGITANGERENYGNAVVVAECIRFDGVCDLKRLDKDPWGFANSIAGYFMEHGGADPVNNYGNLANLQKTVHQDGQVTQVTYHPTKVPMSQLVEMITKAPIDPNLDRVFNAMILSKGNPGQEQTYKSLPEAIAEAFGVQLPEEITGMTDALPEISGIGDVLQGGMATQSQNNSASSATPTAAAPAAVVAPITDAIQSAVASQPEPVKMMVDQGIQMLENFANTGGAAPAAESTPVAPMQQMIDQGMQQLENFANNGTPAAEPTYTAPVDTYQAPATSYQAPQVQQMVDTVNTVVTQVAPQLAPQVNDIANGFASALAGFHP